MVARGLFFGVNMAANAKTTIHHDEIVLDGPEQYLLGCECGWTCNCHAESFELAVSLFSMHYRAVTERELLEALSNR
jgi:hypothetical protein